MNTELKSTSKSIFPTLWIMFFDHTCLNVYIPVFTFVFFDLQSTMFAPDTSTVIRSFWYGVCLGLPHIGNLFCAPILSALSDEFGRKKILALGILGAMVFALIAALGVILGSLSILLIAGIIQGIFSKTNPIAQAAICDISPIESKAKNLGYLLCAICAGAFIGPIIGGYFAKRFLFSSLNFSFPFLIAALFAAIGILLALSIFEETFPNRTKSLIRNGFSWKSIKYLLSNKDVQFISLIFFTTQFTWSMFYQSISPILKQTFHFSASQLGFYMGFIALWLIITGSFVIKLLEKIFMFDRLLLIGLCLMLFGSFLSLISCLFQLPYLIWIASFPVAMGDLISFIYLVTSYSNAVSKEDQGKIMGICFMVVSITWALTGVLSGILLGINMLLPLVVGPLSILVTFVLTILKTHRVQRLEISI